jgi:hypothetical protein
MYKMLRCKLEVLDFVGKNEGAVVRSTDDL